MIDVNPTSQRWREICEYSVSTGQFIVLLMIVKQIRKISILFRIS